MKPKIYKNGDLDLKVSLGVPVDPWITKMVTQGTTNGASGIFRAVKSDPFQQATSPQLPADRGPAALVKP